MTQMTEKGLMICQKIFRFIEEENLSAGIIALMMKSSKHFAYISPLAPPHFLTPYKGA